MPLTCGVDSPVAATSIHHCVVKKRMTLMMPFSNPMRLKLHTVLSIQMNAQKCASLFLNVPYRLSMLLFGKQMRAYLRKYSAQGNDFIYTIQCQWRFVLFLLNTKFNRIIRHCKTLVNMLLISGFKSLPWIGVAWLMFFHLIQVAVIWLWSRALRKKPFPVKRWPDMGMPCVSGITILC